jgi:hypothetical protein
MSGEDDPYHARNPLDLGQAREEACSGRVFPRFCARMGPWPRISTTRSRSPSTASSTSHLQPQGGQGPRPEYIAACLSRGITEIRIIHGKGTGTLKAIVHAVLKRDPRVAGFKDAGIDAGGWGATIVRLNSAECS